MPGRAGWLVAEERDVHDADRSVAMGQRRAVQLPGLQAHVEPLPGRACHLRGTHGLPGTVEHAAQGTVVGLGVLGLRVQSTGHATAEIEPS